MFEFYTKEERNKLKFIVFLREPVARDYSWYQQVMRVTLTYGTKFKDILTYKEMHNQNVKFDHYNANRCV